MLIYITAHYYSIIVVLETGGFLLLPDTGYKIQVKPGDIVCFLASQQYHKLSIDLASNPNARQTVLTLWTDRNAMNQVKEPEGLEFYAVPASEVAT
jgi:hypothetical protein